MTVPFDVNDPKLRHDFFETILPGIVSDLDEEANPQWGKMKAQHIVEHFIWAFRLSTGKIETACKTPSQLLERVKRFLYDNRATPHDFKNPMMGDDPMPFEFPDMSEAKKEFLLELKNYLDYYQRQPDAIHIHPIFGPAGAEEWQRIHFKHFYHHLLQLNAIAESGTHK